MSELQEIVLQLYQGYGSWRKVADALGQGISFATLAAIGAGNEAHYTNQMLNKVRLAVGLPVVSEKLAAYCKSCGEFHHTDDSKGGTVVLLDDQHKVIRRGTPGSNRRMSFRISNDTEAETIINGLAALGYNNLKAFVLDTIATRLDGVQDCE